MTPVVAVLLCREEEELKRIPYEEEMNLCDYLISYLETNFITKESSTSAAADESSPAQPEVVDGMRVHRRSDEDFSAVVNSKSKRGKKKGGGNQKRDVISHGVDTLDSFSLLEVQPPLTAVAVPAAVDQLKAKKESYQGLARGAVESLASKIKAEREKTVKEQTKGKSSAKSVFNLENDFPDLAITPAKADGESTPLA
jgi:hypothetical protein